MCLIILHIKEGEIEIFVEDPRDSKLNFQLVRKFIELLGKFAKRCFHPLHRQQKSSICNYNSFHLHYVFKKPFEAITAFKKGCGKLKRTKLLFFYLHSGEIN